MTATDMLCLDCLVIGVIAFILACFLAATSWRRILMLEDALAYVLSRPALPRERALVAHLLPRVDSSRNTRQRTINRPDQESQERAETQETHDSGWLMDTDADDETWP